VSAPPQTTFSLGQIAEISGGRLTGDPSRQITGAASLTDAEAGDITFFTNRKYAAHLRNTRAAAVFVPLDFAEPTPAVQIHVPNPMKAFEQVVAKFARPPILFAPGVHEKALVDPGAKLGEGVSIQPYAVIEPGVEIGDGTFIGAGTYVGHETVIGANCTIYPGVTIRERAKIGVRVIIHSGAVIGADGFGFEPTEAGYEKIPQLGIVQIDDDVEIGANTTIDRARFGRTWIQRGVKIDNLVHVAHNVVIGENTVMAAQIGIAGSTRVGKRVVMGGQVGTVGHIEIGDDTTVAAKAGVSKSIAGGSWWGAPAQPLAKEKEQVVWLRNLGKLFARLKELERKVAQLRGRGGGDSRG
jgi:UDP-3-O-[3-hydroxymyristoyl] glucosamine N-acyltransferase